MAKKIAEHSIPPGFNLRYILRGHTSVINQIAWSPDGRQLASSSNDHTIRLWDADSGVLLRSLQGHEGDVSSVAWSPDGRMLASGSRDKTIRIWDASTGSLLMSFHGHTDHVRCVAWSLDGQMLVSGASDHSIRLWNTVTGTPYRTLEGPSSIRTVAWSPDGRRLAAGTAFNTVQLWDTERWMLAHTLSGHTNWVRSVVWAPNGEILATASDDRTARLWDVTTGSMISVIEGPTDYVTSVSFSADGQFLALKSKDGTVQLRYGDYWEEMVVLDEPISDIGFDSGLAFHPSALVLATLGEENTAVRIWDLDRQVFFRAAATTTSTAYVNAKVVLVGESGVGKSGLGIRIAEKEFRPTDSTHGAQFWQIPVPEATAAGDGRGNVRAEITLWDLAGQADYHLVHQLFLDDTDAALLLFDCSDPTDPFRGVHYWAKVLKKQTRPNTLKFLVSARCDVSPVTVDQLAINRILAQYGLHGYLRTSAKSTEGVDALFKRLVESIPWSTLPRTTRPHLFQIIREFLLERKAAGGTIIPMDEIRRQVRQRSTEQAATQADIDTVIALLQAQGLVHRLNPTPKVALVLLRPELINQYAGAIIQAARNHDRGIGAIPERDVIAAELPFTGFDRLEPNEEKTVLESTVELFIRHDLCFREMGLLVFPSQLNLTRPAPDSQQPPAEVTYQFSGATETIYASLVVRLSYTSYFQREDQWKYAAEFSRNGYRLGFAMRQVEEGTGELEIYFYPGVSDFDRVTFIRFITDHLRTKGIDIQERIRLYCSHCSREVVNRDAIEERVRAKKLDILCQYCETPVIIPRSIEDRYHSDPSYSQKQRQLTQTVEQRTRHEVQAFHADRRQYSKDAGHMLHLLHLSDIHLGTPAEARKYRAQLETDLKQELKISRLEYLILSGDIGDRSTAAEYEAAFELIDGLVKRFGLDPSRVVVVPGNHDVNWDASEEAYPFVPKRKLPAVLPEGKYIPAGEAGALLRDEELYRERFAQFSTHFYKKVYSGTPYPLDYAEQAILHVRPDDRILFLALNSCWEIDHYPPHHERASINMEALTRALDQLADGDYERWLKIAVWHHPVTGRQAMNDEFLELLAVHGFQIGMHGHIHEAIEGYHKYDNQRGMHIIGAGTFGAPAKGQVPGIPLQYNLLVLDPQAGTLTVESRKKEKPDGAWSADARWGDKNNPSPRYTIDLSKVYKADSAANG